MGYKIFISYKFSDCDVYPLNYSPLTSVRSYVDKLETYFDNKTDHIYKGESNNDDLSYLSENELWERLKDRIYDSSVTIVIISPRMKMSNKTDKSQWIPWEISFSLKETTRNDRVSRSNAMLAVVLPDSNNSYEYFFKDTYCQNCSCQTLLTNTLFDILRNNMFNKKTKTRKDCDKTTVYTGIISYIECVKWTDFTSSPQYYIDEAIKRKNNIDDYEITKSV